MGDSCCAIKEPGYASLKEAQYGPREKIIYITAIYTDIDSKTYGQIVHRLPVGNLNDELHHSGWNACSSCHEDTSVQRRYLVLPSLVSGRIYIIDTVTDPLKPALHKTVEAEEIVEKTEMAFPHTPHYLANGDIMVSCLGDKGGRASGVGFLLLDDKFNVKGRWEEKGHSPPFGYNFWYQPRFKTMISSSWGAPLAFTKGFNPAQIRFLHDPKQPIGYVGCALSSTVVRFFKKDDDTWDHDVAITVPNLKVENWILPEIPGLITDFFKTLDDLFLYFSN